MPQFKSCTKTKTLQHIKQSREIGRNSFFYLPRLLILLTAAIPTFD
jgi:hypothetical protein